jgi:MFS family permease
MTNEKNKITKLVFPNWMNRDLKVIYVARLLMSINRALAGIVVAIYFSIDGLTAVDLGIVFLGVGLFSAILSSSIGITSDQIGRKVFMVVVPFLTATASLVFFATRSLPLLIAAAVIGSFGRGAGAGAGAVGPYQSVESALAAENTGSANRNKIFGRLGFASSIGATVGSLLTLTIPTHKVTGSTELGVYHAVFFLAFLSALGAGLVALLLKKDRVLKSDRPKFKFKFPKKSKSLVYKLWVTNSLNGIAVGMFGPFVSYWFYRRYGAGPKEIGILFAVINVVTIGSTLSAAGLAKKMGLVNVVTVVRAFQSLLLIPMVLAPSFIISGGIYLVRMLIQRIALPLRQSYVIGMADENEKAAVTSMSNLPNQVMMSVSPMFSGYLFDYLSEELPFEIAGVFQLANTVAFYLFFHKTKPAEETFEKLDSD